jgi:Protein of unknown function (DUF3829)
MKPLPPGALRPTFRLHALGSALRVGVLASALVLAPGCDKLVGALEETAEEVTQEVASVAADPAAPGEPVLTEDEKLSNKLGLYIECMNRASARIRDSWLRYDERVKEDGTPRKKGTKPFLYKIDSELTPCQEAVDKGPAAEPPLPDIEKAMASYLEHAKAFAATTVTLDTYYEQENYEDDAWAKGKELAPGFATAFTAWSKADEELDALVETRKDVVDRNVLALVEQRKGKNIEWHSRNYLLAAKAFGRCATSEAAAAPAKPAKGAPAKTTPPATPPAEAQGCEPSFTALDEAGTAFRTFYEANQAAADAVFWMSSFQSTVADYLAEAKKLQRALGKGSASPEQHNKLIEEYNDLVSASNNLRFEG